MTEENFFKTPTLVDLSVNGETETLELPAHIGPYKIESLLDKGGMSLLYLAIHPKTYEPLIVKVLLSKFVNQKQMVAQFLKEAQIIEMTNHPNIVKVFGHGQWEEGLYIAMEFVQGISLRQLILQQALSLKRALEITLQIAHALTHLHAHGIIHRDLKPENILLTANGGIKVIDFGIALVHSDEPEKQESEKKTLMGTPVYMSPEQRKNPLSVSFATDIYSLGLITYELLSGRLSYGSVHLSLIPRGLQKIIALALKPKIEDRYEDIVDFIGAVSSYLASDELKKDMRGSDYLGELSENLKEAQTILLPSAPPNWPKMDVACASNLNGALSAVTYDFFQPKDGVFSIVMAEAMATGVEGLLYIAQLRGMIRAIARMSDSPKELINALNARIIEDNSDLAYSLALLTLEPAVDSFSYISCGYSPLWFLPSGAGTPRRLTSDNVALGVIPDLETMDVTSNWRIGDRVVLHTFQAGMAKSVAEIESDEEQFLAALKENLRLSPSQQVDAIFRKVIHKEPGALFERPTTVISIQRND